MQIKIMMKCYFTYTRNSVIKNEIIRSVSEVKLEPSCTAGMNVKWLRHFGKQSGRYPKGKEWVTTWPSNSTPRYIPGEIKPAKTCTIAALFPTVKRWRQPNVQQLVSELAKYSVYTTKYYSAIKKEWGSSHFGSGG